MNKDYTRDDLLALARDSAGRRRRRLLKDSDIDDFINLSEEYPDYRVRVYSSDGFVANSYGYGAHIQYIEQTRTGEVVVDWGVANRGIKAKTRYVYFQRPTNNGGK